MPIAMDLADIADRYAILLLKGIHLPEERQSLLPRIGTYEAALDEALKADPWVDVWARELLQLLACLYYVNAALWMTEGVFRKYADKAEDAVDSDRALAAAVRIRQLNKIRCYIKNRIAQRVGEPQEVKVNYAGEDDLRGQVGAVFMTAFRRLGDTGVPVWNWVADSLVRPSAWPKDLDEWAPWLSWSAWRTWWYVRQALEPAADRVAVEA